MRTVSTERRTMKKTILMLMLLAMLMPISTKAQEVPSIELIEEDADGTIISDPYHYSIDWTTVGYKPKEVTVQKQSKSFVVFADITTASRKVEVQYSRDPSFRYGVKTVSFRNLSYKAPVLAFTATDGARVGNNWYYNDSIILKQSGKVLTSRRKRVGEWSRLCVTQGDVNASRKKIRCVKRMYVPNVTAPNGMYVRLRNVFDGNTHKTVYSGWSRIVRVK